MYVGNPCKIIEGIIAKYVLGNLNASLMNPFLQFRTSLILACRGERSDLEADQTERSDLETDQTEGSNLEITFRGF